MDFDKILEKYRNKACVISVEKFSDGSFGNIRIAAGNKAHCDDMLNVMHRPFVPDSPYEQYLPQNKNFEDYCCRSAFLGESLHSYVNLPQMGLWLNMYLHSLESDKENIGYCVYIYDVTPYLDSEKQASLSAETSEAVIETCIKLRGSGDIRQRFGEVIEDIRRICDSDHCCVLLVDNNTRNCMNLCEAIRPGCGLLPMDTYLDDNFYSITETWRELIGTSTCIIIKDQRDMEWLKDVNPVWHESLSAAGAKSIVMFPLNYNNETLGYMWAINFNVENVVKIKETLELTTFFIASEIANYQLLKKLEILSSIDALTGVKNRNTMNNDIDKIKSGEKSVKDPCVVVIADLNGLKRINDEKGHAAGDDLLKKAASILTEVFFDCDVYRAGGDEFVLIADNEKIDAQLKQLEELALKNDIHFAIGTSIVNESIDILTAMHIADERMYDNKEEYYKSNPDLKYR